MTNDEAIEGLEKLKELECITQETFDEFTNKGGVGEIKFLIGYFLALSYLVLLNFGVNYIGGMCLNLWSLMLSIPMITVSFIVLGQAYENNKPETITN